MTRDEFIQRAVISMAGKVVDTNGEITDKEAVTIVMSAAGLANKAESYTNWDE